MLNLSNKIKMIITDFDGIITDNCAYIDSKGEFSRKVNFKDIMAFSILKKNGFKIGIISGESNSAIDTIAKKFEIEEIHQGIRNKISVLESIIKKYNLNDEEFIYIGDDINDFESLNRAKYAFTVPDAVEKIKSIEHIQTTNSHGGNGAFREVVDAIIDSRNHPLV